MYKNVASQKLIVFAFDSTTNLPKTGDAANLTAYVSKDYGAVTVLGDTSAAEMDSTNAKGYYLFDLTQSETNADTLLFSAKSSTANIVAIGVPATVFTEPANFHALSIDSSGRVDVAKVGGTSQTAKDLGAINVTNLNTLSGHDPGATLASTTNITAGTVTTATNVTTVNGLAAGVITATSIAADAITAAKIADGAIDRATFAADTGHQSARSNTAAGGGATSITLDASASATTDFYTGAWVYITGNTGAGQWRLITAYNGSTKVATVAPAWATNPDNTSTFAIMPAAKISGVTLADTLTTYTGNTPQTGDSFARIGATGSGLTSLAPSSTALSTATWTSGRAANLDNLDTTVSSRGTSTLTQTQVTGGAYSIQSSSCVLGDARIANLDAAVTTRMATYSQPTGFLAATFPTTVASTTNITSASGVALTSAYDFAKGTVAMTESYNADGSAPTPVQALFLTTQMLTEMSISGTTMTIKKLDGSTTAFTLTLNDASTPTSLTRAT
jgi:hypothetical protein